MTDLLLSKARDFTDIEDKCLDAWLTAENLQLDQLAADILDAGLMTEHYRSLLDADPEKITPDQSTQLLQLHAAFETQLGKLIAALQAQVQTDAITAKITKYGGAALATKAVGGGN